MNAPRTRVVRRPVHGVLLLDKPLGMSSNQALQKVKWLLRAEKAGHTGTLDPLASGLLPLCFGAATKFSQVHLDASKTYEAVIELGVKTTTGDAEGDVMERRDVAVTPAQIDEAIAAFRGPIRQVPPMHSALKRDGKALYEYAREGIELEREPRDVVIHALSWEPVNRPAAQLEEENEQLPSTKIGSIAIKIVANVSKGTYIRTLGEDIAQRLGCGGHLSFLRRHQSGHLKLDQAVTLPQLEAMPDAQRAQHLLGCDALIEDWPKISIDEANAARLLAGLRRRIDAPNADNVAVYGPTLSPDTTPSNVFLGAAKVTAGELIPVRLMTPLEIKQTLEV
jgi:tRNA pseudouridine55 synthase